MNGEPPISEPDDNRSIADPEVRIAALRPKLAEFIQREEPSLGPESFISLEQLNDFRVEYVRSLFETEMGEVSRLEEDVLESLRQHELVTERLALDADQQRSFGERLSDHLAHFGGSWTFIIAFSAVLLLWVIVNGVWLGHRAFDPYPFIFLNLLLSCLAALQAPIIMMSQNRVEMRDRLRAESDYKVNLKAELEIRHLNEKLDHLLRTNTERLLDIQQIQLELLRELTTQRGKLAR